MRRKLIIDGNAVYEIDDDCAHRKETQMQQTQRHQGSDEQTIRDAGGKKEGWKRSKGYRDDDKTEKPLI